MLEIRVKSGRVEPIAGKFGSSRVVDRAKTLGQLNSGIFNFFVHSSINSGRAKTAGAHTFR